MALTEEPISFEIPVQIGDIKLVFFVSQNLYCKGNECISRPHNHGDYEIRYTVFGSGCQHIEEQAITTSENDVLLLRPNEYHYQDTISELEQYSIRFSIKQPSEQSNAAQKKSYIKIIEILSQTRLLRDNDGELLITIKRLAKEICERKSGYFNCLQAICVIIFTEFMRLIDNNLPPFIFPSTAMKHTGFIRTQIDTFLGFRYMDNVKLNDLADALNVSTRQASRIIKNEFNMSYTEKLLQTRLQNAKLQIKQTDKTFHNICMDCGFQSYNHFFSCFRKATGMTPSEYRRKFESSVFPD